MEPFIHTGAMSITWVSKLGRGQPHPPMVHAEPPKEDAFQQQPLVSCVAGIFFTV